MISCNTKNQGKIDWNKIADEMDNTKLIKEVKNPHLPIIDLDRAESVGFIDFAKKFIKEAKYIPLRKEGSPIGNINYVLIYKDRMFVLDTQQTSSVYIFDLEGNFISTAGSRGQGPGEYLAPEMISVVEENPPLLAVCDRNLYMNYYSFDGKFIRREKRFFGSFAIKHKESIFNSSVSGLLGKGKNDYDLVVSKKDSLLYKGFREYPLQGSASTSQFILRSNNNKLFFTPLLSDTTYHILSDSTYTPYLAFKHKNSIWKEEYLYQNKDPYKLIKEKNLAYIKQPVCETPKVLSFQLMTRGEENPNSVIYNFCYYMKETNQVIRLSNKNRDNIRTEKTFFNEFTNPINVYGDYFICVLTPDIFDVYRVAKKEGFVIKNKDLDEIVNDESVDQAVVLFRL